ncbi:hypothetical protein FQA39_LY00230 [Lamprigera yunnana]|nr:hypothetical protein FQA39_LY00230 [Lamprigera yunnana]
MDYRRGNKYRLRLSAKRKRTSNIDKFNKARRANLPCLTKAILEVYVSTDIEQEHVIVPVSSIEHTDNLWLDCPIPGPSEVSKNEATIRSRHSDEKMFLGSDDEEAITLSEALLASKEKTKKNETFVLEAETRGQGRRGGRSRGRGRGLGRSQGGVCSSNKANRRQNVNTSSSSSESDAIIETDSEYDGQVNSDTPESLDTSWIFCGMNYSSDTHGEEWIQCLSCSLWAHTACAGPEGENYICDFCH